MEVEMKTTMAGPIGQAAFPGQRITVDAKQGKELCEAGYAVEIKGGEPSPKRPEKPEPETASSPKQRKAEKASK